MTPDVAAPPISAVAVHAGRVRRLTVLHVQKAAGISGAERHVLSLLPALAGADIDVTACVLVTGDGGSYVDRLRDEGVTTEALRAGTDVNPMLVPRLRALIRGSGADVVHTHLIHADVHGALAARLAGVPVVSSVHGRPAFYGRQPYLGAGRLVGRLAARRIAISPAVAEFVRALRLARPAGLEVIPYGIDCRAWEAAPGDVEGARRANGLSPEDVVVGIASRLIPLKGHTALIDAVGYAATDAPELRVLVAGGGPLHDDLVARAERAAPGRVRFLGFVSDVRSFMHACDVIAFPTEPELGEGFGLAALEGMASGRPVVATASGALDDLVTDGETGFLVPPRSPGALAEALVRLAREPGLRQRMGEAAARRAAERYSIAAMVTATAAVYRSVATPR